MILDKNIRITPEGSSEIKTKPPRNVPKMLPAEFKALSLPTTAPDESTLRIAKRATNGDIIPSKILEGAKIIKDDRTEAMYKFNESSDRRVRIKLLPKAVTAIIIAEVNKILPNNFPSGRLSAIEPPIQFPMHRLVIIIPINAVHTIKDVPKNGATILEPVSSRIIVAAPLKKETICSCAAIFTFNLMLLLFFTNIFSLRYNINNFIFILGYVR